MKADTIRKAPNIDLEGKVDAWRALVAHMRAAWPDRIDGPPVLDALGAGVPSVERHDLGFPPRSWTEASASSQLGRIRSRNRRDPVVPRRR
jgi:hypothetical protein